MSDGFIFAGQGVHRMTEWDRGNKSDDCMNQTVAAYRYRSHNQQSMDIPVVTTQVEQFLPQSVLRNIWQICTLTNLYLGGERGYYV